MHTFVDFGQEGGYKFRDLKGVERRTCKAALGFSFAGGTTDGPGNLDFTQNEYRSQSLSFGFEYNTNCHTVLVRQRTPCGS